MLVEEFGYAEISTRQIVADLMGVPPVPRTSRERFQELLAGSDRKSVSRMTDNIRVNVFGEVKPDCQSSWVRVGVVIGNQRNTGRVRETHCYRSRLPVYMRRSGE